MSKLKTDLAHFLAYLALAVVAVTLYAASHASAGYPLDDAWIHQTYARN